MDEKASLTVKEAAQMMGVDVMFLRCAIHQGKIPGAIELRNGSSKRRSFYIPKIPFLNWLNGLDDQKENSLLQQATK